MGVHVVTSGKQDHTYPIICIQSSGFHAQVNFHWTLASSLRTDQENRTVFLLAASEKSWWCHQKASCPSKSSYGAVGNSHHLPVHRWAWWKESEFQVALVDSFHRWGSMWRWRQRRTQWQGSTVVPGYLRGLGPENLNKQQNPKMSKSLNRKAKYQHITMHILLYTRSHPTLLIIPVQCNCCVHSYHYCPNDVTIARKVYICLAQM
jgi:hypothetical protein